MPPPGIDDDESIFAQGQLEDVHGLLNIGKAGRQLQTTFAVAVNTTQRALFVEPGG